MAGNTTSANDPLSRRTFIFGLHLWIVIGISVGAAFLLLLVFISCWFASRRKTNTSHHHPNSSSELVIPTISRVEIQPPRPKLLSPESKPHATPTTAPRLPLGEEIPAGSKRNHTETGKDPRIAYPEHGAGNGSPHGSRESRSAEQAAISIPKVSHLGWGQWYTLRELEDATNGFSHENVIGEGGYGIVYHGVLEDQTHVAVKNLLNNRGQAEREFEVEVEAIGRVRHKSLVRLLGYCGEGAHRMLVYEYVDNGNLEQWLHGNIGPSSPLSWEIRMKVILGTAKGLMYLHEGLEPKVVHRDIKASNILLDKQWNAKVSDFGLAKLLGPERTYVTTRVMGTFGYVAPEYAKTGMLNERSDIYSFGILIMETISGRKPIDYSRPPGEVNLVEWLKVMVSNKNSEGVLDPKLPKQPNSRALKKTLLVALRCVDPDSTKRPKMGHVINMLEMDDFPYRDENRTGGQGRNQSNTAQDRPNSIRNVNADTGDHNSGRMTVTAHVNRASR